MSTASAVPATIDALVTLFTASLAGVAAVYDGPGLTDSADAARLHVGLSDVDADDFDVAASAEQGWPWIGHTQRDETFAVHCVAWATNGDADLKAARDAAYRVVQAVTDALQADPSFGAVVLFSAGVTTATLLQLQYQDGAEVRLPFDIECRARLS